MKISVGARRTPLSQAQVHEVLMEIQEHFPHVQFLTHFIETTGDRNRSIPLWEVSQTDFFTKELDNLQLRGEFRISIHSAKDLPNPLPDGLSIGALTRGVSPHDVLLLPLGLSLDTLPLRATIGTSSKRRTEAIHRLRSDLQPISIRGTIHERIRLMDEQKVQGLVMAEAALIRLNLTHLNHIPLSCEAEPLQGKLAIIVKEDDEEMKRLFEVIHAI